jgi:hypothetical protein
MSTLIRNLKLQKIKIAALLPAHCHERLVQGWWVKMVTRQPCYWIMPSFKPFNVGADLP